MKENANTDPQYLASHLRGVAAGLLEDPLADRSTFAGFSIKTSCEDEFGEEQDVLLYTSLSQDILSEPVSYTLELARVRRVADADYLPVEAAMRELDRSVLEGPARLPWAVQLHALISVPVVYTVPDLLALSCAAFCDGGTAKENLPIEGARFIHRGVITPATAANLILEMNSDSGVLCMEGRGLVIFGPDLNSADSLLKNARSALHNSTRVELPAAAVHDLDVLQTEETARLRSILSRKAGQPILIRTYRLNEAFGKLVQRIEEGSAEYVYHELDRYFPGPVLDMDELLQDESGVESGEYTGTTLYLVKGTQSLVIGAASADLLQRADEVIQFGMKLYATSPAFGGPKPGLQEEADSGPVDFPLILRDRSVFTGEVALVSGAASGIGKAVAASLLERGACVIGLDINPEVVDVLHSVSYLGIPCDLTDEAAVELAFRNTVASFGGLDMMVLNAGIFPPSMMVGEMDMGLWRKVMSINLDSNLHLLKCAYPLLKLAPDHGRVVFNASRNVPAPGPGAAAYSSSKAAFTQLARVTAMEWGGDHIPVNIIHPHAVFDTGIWTKEVLESRAAKYGITVEEYKTNNVLGVELSSRDVGEIVAEICGPHFAKVTGAQIPVDGGSNRVI